MTEKVEPRQIAIGLTLSVYGTSKVKHPGSFTAESDLELHYLTMTPICGKYI
jgi:hypothetical protein